MASTQMREERLDRNRGFDRGDDLQLAVTFALLDVADAKLSTDGKWPNAVRFWRGPSSRIADCQGLAIPTHSRHTRFHQSAVSDPWAGNVAAQPLEILVLVRAAAHRGMQAEAVRIRIVVTFPKRVPTIAVSTLIAAPQATGV